MYKYKGKNDEVLSISATNMNEKLNFSIFKYESSTKEKKITS